MNPFRWLAEALKSVIRWWMESLQVMGYAVVQGLSDGLAWAIPDIHEVLEPFEDHLAWANHFFPLTETVALGTTFLGLWATLAASRFVKRLIPGLSG